MNANDHTRSERFRSLDTVVNHSNIKPSLYDDLPTVNYRPNWKNIEYAIPNIDLRYFLSSMVRYKTLFPENKSKDHKFYMTNSQLDETIWEYIKIHHTDKYKTWLNKLHSGFEQGKSMRSKDYDQIRERVQSAGDITFSELREHDQHFFSDSLSGKIYSIRNLIIRELSSAGKIVHQEAVPGYGKNLLKIHPMYVRRK
ncbi:hypothetical protein K9M79_03200 [Candidatus Woesearchaeota archaeon]|nr:hypothetical protein [Candidatus Woesearchaeota archaeon]